MRDPGVLTALDALERYARAFDEISAEAGAHYSARSFVRWVRLEAAAPPTRASHPLQGEAGHRSGMTRGPRTVR